MAKLDWQDWINKEAFLLWSRRRDRGNFTDHRLEDWLKAEELAKARERESAFRKLTEVVDKRERLLPALVVQMSAMLNKWPEEISGATSFEDFSHTEFLLLTCSATVFAGLRSMRINRTSATRNLEQLANAMQSVDFR